jgi:hypothetical protein
MSKLFYDHLIVIEDFVAIFEEYSVPTDEKGKLLETIEEILHHHIFDTVLTHLPRNHHETFLEKFASHPGNEDILIFLKDKTKVDIEKEIVRTVARVKAKILKDIQSLREEK